jgi:hypothetical protein
MFLAGFVHCDISSGNLLRFSPLDGGPTRGILGDLEYSKDYSKDTKFDPQMVSS